MILHFSHIGLPAGLTFMIPFGFACPGDAGSGRRRGQPLPVADVRLRRRTATNDSRGVPPRQAPGNAAAPPMNGPVPLASRSPAPEPVRDISMTTRASLPGGLRTAIV